MISKSNIIILIAFILCIFGLFKIKYKVLELRRDTKELAAALDKEKRELNSLKVEWAYLSNPQRIATLAAKYLHLSNNKIKKTGENQPITTIKIHPEGRKTKIMNIAYKHAKGGWRYRRDNHAVTTTRSPIKATK